jgi:hypothetical protein
MTTFDWALTDILIVLLVLISLTLAMTVKKMRDLLRLDYRLHPTGVPNKVTRLVQAAESHYYSEHRASLAVEAVWRKWGPKMGTDHDFSAVALL